MLSGASRCTKTVLYALQFVWCKFFKVLSFASSVQVSLRSSSSCWCSRPDRIHVLLCGAFGDGGAWLSALVEQVLLAETVFLELVSTGFVDVGRLLGVLHGLVRVSV